MVTRRTIGMLALAGALAAAPAACSSKKTSAEGPSQELTLKVGLLYTSGGRGADLAQAALGASTLAASASAARFNVKVEIVQGDYTGDLKLAAAKIADLRAKSDAIVVGTDDPAIAPLLDPVNDHPVMHAFITADDLVRGHGNVFRLVPTDDLQARALAAFLVGHRKYERIAVLSDTTRFGREGSTDVQAALAQAGVSPVLARSFEPGGDIHTPVMEAGGKSVDALVVWAESPNEAARVVVEAHRMGWAYQIVLSGNLATATFAKNASAQVTPVAFGDGMLSVGAWAGPWFRLERVIGFYKDFRIQNSAFAPAQAAAVNDAVLALAAAARAEGTGAKELIAGLESLTDFEGAGVPVTFGPGKHEGIDLDDIAMLAFTKSQDSAGGEFFPDVDTGGGFFTVLTESLNLPDKYRFLTLS